MDASTDTERRRWARPSLVPLLVLSLTLPGCFDGFGDGLGEGVGDAGACIDAELDAGLSSILEKHRMGERGRVDLIGLCNVFEACDEGSPLMAGSDFTVLFDGNTSGDEDGTDPFDLVSSNPSAVSALATERVCSVMQGRIGAGTTGAASLVVRAANGDELDRFHIEVAEPVSLTVTAPSADDPGVPVLAPGEMVLLQAAARDSDERLLSARSSIQWSVADDGVLVPSDEVSLRGGALVLEAASPGSTLVTVSAAGLEAALEVTVR